jgi:hypothetical protein
MGPNGEAAKQTQKPAGGAIVRMTRFAVSLFFAANYQPATGRVPRKSSLADYAGERRNSLLADPPLFSTVSGAGADREGGPTGHGSRRATFSISHPATISQVALIVNLA